MSKDDAFYRHAAHLASLVHANELAHAPAGSTARIKLNQKIRVEIDELVAAGRSKDARRLEALKDRLVASALLDRHQFRSW